MTPQVVFRAHLNPLAFPEVDLAELIEAEPTLEAVVKYLCPAGVPSDLSSLISRYREISTEKPGLTIVPDERRVSDKLVAPLRHAKAAYMVGNYLATVALCGTVAEMLAILQWELSESSLNNQPMTQRDEAALFGDPFERLTQDRRIKVLVAYGLISEPVRADLDLIRTTRRKYLHLWSEDHQETPEGRRFDVQIRRQGRRRDLRREH